jgi:uncharacterized protein
MSSLEIILVLLAAAAAFTTSAAAGLGGSLILVPALALLLGTKEGVALAALLLALNNVVKVFAYRRTIPLAGSAIVIAWTIVGSAVGAWLLVAAPASLVSAGVVASIGLSLLAERLTDARPTRRAAAPALAFASGATSGFSGTSGPLKGVALRHLELDFRRPAPEPHRRRTWLCAPVLDRHVRLLPAPGARVTAPNFATQGT